MQTLQEVTQDVNFSTVCRNVTASTVWPTLKPGDKVLYQVTHRYTGAQFKRPAILVRKPSDQRGKATIKVRLSDKRTGNVAWQTKSVETNNLFRYDWPDAQGVKP